LLGGRGHNIPGNMADDKAASKPLHMGDIIYLSVNRDDFDGYISSEGFVDNRITMQWYIEDSGQLPENFAQCLFRVVPKRAYKAQIQVRKEEKKMQLLRRESMELDLQVYKEQEEREHEQNETSFMEAVRDERTFNYGDICQLQHVLSKKFITMDGEALADADNEALKIRLVENGTKGSWLQFRPRFKNRAMGQPVFVGDQLVFRHEVTIHDYLRVSAGFLKFSRGSAPDMTVEAMKKLDSEKKKYEEEDLQYFTSRCELNLSTAQPYTALKIKLFAPGSAVGIPDDTGKMIDNLQLTTMALRLFHAESDAMISASANQYAASQPDQNLKLPYLFKKRADEDDDLDDEKNFISKSLWVIESVTRSEGGGLEIAGESRPTKDGIVHPLAGLVRIKHAISGRYLTVDHRNPIDEDTAFKKGMTKLENTGPLFDVRLTQTLGPSDNGSLEDNPNATHDQDVRTFFKLHSVAGPSDEEDISPILTVEDIETQNIWIEHPFVRYEDDVAITEPITVVDDDGKEEPWESCWLHSTLIPKDRKPDDLFDRENMTLKFCGNRLDEDSLQIFVGAEYELGYVNNILSCHPIAKMYYDRVTQQGGPSLAAEEGKFVIAMLKFLIHFALGEEVGDTDPMELDGFPEEINQRMLREGKMIDALFLMLSAPMKANLRLDRLKMDYPQMETIHNLTLRAIKFSFLSNFRNELYLADRSLKQWNFGDESESYMKMLIHSLQTHPEAAVVYQELVSNNRKLLETKIDEKDVEIFIDLIQTRGPVSEFLQFLTAICKCKDEPLVHNQELMLKEVYSAARDSGTYERNRYKLLIETIVDPREGEDSHDRMLSFEEKTRPQDIGTVEGGNILEDGFSHLLIGWYGYDLWTESDTETAFYYSPSSLGLKTVTVDENLLPKDLVEYHQRVGLNETGKKFQWVMVRDILWTLQPEVMKRRAAAGGEDKAKQSLNNSEVEGWTAYEKRMDSNKELRRRFDNTKKLAEYYVAQSSCTRRCASTGATTVLNT